MNGLKMAGFVPIQEFISGKEEIRIYRPIQNPRIYFSGTAMKHLNGRYVAVWADDEKKAIAFQPADRKGENTVRVIRSKNSEAHVRARGILEYLRERDIFRGKFGKNYRVEWDEGENALIWWVGRRKKWSLRK